MPGFSVEDMMIGNNSYRRHKISNFVDLKILVTLLVCSTPKTKQQKIKIQFTNQEKSKFFRLRYFFQLHWNKKEGIKVFQADPVPGCCYIYIVGNQSISFDPWSVRNVLHLHGGKKFFEETEMISRQEPSQESSWEPSNKNLKSE